MDTALLQRRASVILDIVELFAIPIVQKVNGAFAAQKNVNVNRAQVVMQSQDIVIVLPDIMDYIVRCSALWVRLGTTVPTHVSAKTMLCAITLRDSANVSQDLLGHSVRRSVRVVLMAKIVNKLAAVRMELFAAKRMEHVFAPQAGPVLCVRRSARKDFMERDAANLVNATMMLGVTTLQGSAYAAQASSEKNVMFSVLLDFLVKIARRLACVRMGQHAPISMDHALVLLALWVLYVSTEYVQLIIMEKNVIRAVNVMLLTPKAVIRTQESAHASQDGTPLFAVRPVHLLSMVTIASISATAAMKPIVTTCMVTASVLPDIQANGVNCSVLRVCMALTVHTLVTATMEPPVITKMATVCVHQDGVECDAVSHAVLGIMVLIAVWSVSVFMELAILLLECVLVTLAS